MEDALDACQRTCDPLNPVVCIDETNKQLIKETRIPCTPGHTEKVDFEYERNGVADVFMIFEPLAGKRETIITETRNAIDFANTLDPSQNSETSRLCSKFTVSKQPYQKTKYL